MFLNTGQANHHHTGQPQRFPIHHFPLTTLPAPKVKCVYQPEQTQGQQHILGQSHLGGKETPP